MPWLADAKGWYRLKVMQLGQIFCFCEFRFELDGAGARIIVDDFCGFCNDLVRISLLADFRFQICVLLMVHYFLNSFMAFY